jgi:hypothetical protein
MNPPEPGIQRPIMVSVPRQLDFTKIQAKRPRLQAWGVSILSVALQIHHNCLGLLSRKPSQGNLRDTRD